MTHSDHKHTATVSEGTVIVIANEAFNHWKLPAWTIGSRGPADIAVSLFLHEILTSLVAYSREKFLESDKLLQLNHTEEI